MRHWLLDGIQEQRTTALKFAEKVQVYREVANARVDVDFDLIRNTASALELAALDLILKRLEENAEKLALMRGCAADAFRLYRVLPHPREPIELAVHLLRMSALAVLGDMGADAARLLRQTNWQNLPLESADWGKRTWGTILDVWLRLIRKQGWEDRDTVLNRIAALRISQVAYEKEYLAALPHVQAKAGALELIGLYHLAKAAEIFGLFITNGEVEGNYQVRQLLDAQFDRVAAACEPARLMDLEPLSRLLASCADQMVQNSIWTVTRSAPARVNQFVKSLVDRGRGTRAIFEVLPPQRRALAEQGLLGSSRRAVVVSLPTSSGKTLIAQFRILQALNQFEFEQGWVAYLAPTRTLVNQVARQLRRDFAPLEIVVEQISPALELDGVEMGVLKEQDPKQRFRVLVTTPEKMDLMLRQEWEKKIERPLTLVVVDEAHNIQDIHRGLRLELLLATINKEHAKVQFLLLTPFIPNAREIARWLGGQDSDDVSLTLDWQPNDRVIGVAQVERGAALGRDFDYNVKFDTVHTSRKTLTTDGSLDLLRSGVIAANHKKASNQSAVAAITAQSLHKRGPVIVMHSRVDWVESLAKKLAIAENQVAQVSPQVQLVQDYLRLEFGESFPMVNLLSFGIGLHHSGLSDDVRMLVEWLFEAEALKFLVATTTVAQGVNFPVSAVVMASHQYPLGQAPFWMDMPPEDFWNIAGRAGRVSHGQLGIVALAADSSQKGDVLKSFINKRSEDLNSALIQLALNAREAMENLERIIYSRPEWSTFVQYLAHTYLQMGKPESFVADVEQVLRGTLGYEKLRSHNPMGARQLLIGVRNYCEYIQRPRQPLKLVDSTGFSLQSVNGILANSNEIDQHSWNEATLFSQGNVTLQKMMGILLKVPELRDNLEAAIGGRAPDGNKLALIIKDWVNGETVVNIADRYFEKNLTKCGQHLFGKLTQTASWGLGALLAITTAGSELSEAKYKELSNLPSRVFYGVNSEAAIALRLLGVPRVAAPPLTTVLSPYAKLPLPQLREKLKELSENEWKRALGDSGSIYRRVWRTLEGLEN